MAIAREKLAGLLLLDPRKVWEEERSDVMSPRESHTSVPTRAGLTGPSRTIRVEPIRPVRTTPRPVPTPARRPERRREKVGA